MVKMLRLAAVLFLMGLPFFCARAQGGFIEESLWSNINPSSAVASDFIIRTDGSKLFGEIVRNYDYADYDKVVFEKDGKTETYSPADLNSFGLDNGRFFVSKKLSEGSSPEFVQVLLSGRLQLNYRKGNYFLDNGTDIQKLHSYYENIPGDRASKKRNVKLYISTLKINTAGLCGIELIDLIEKARVDEQDFIQILTQYHECEKLPYKVHVLGIPFVKFSPTIALGIATELTYSSNLPININYSFGESMGYSVFAGFRLHDFRRFPKSSLDLRVGYVSRSSVLESSYSTSFGVITGSQGFTENSFVFPFSYNFSFIKRKDAELYVGFIASGWINSIKDDFAILDHAYYLGDGEIALMEGTFLRHSDYSIVPGIKLGGNLPFLYRTRLFGEIQAEYLKDYYKVAMVNLPNFPISRTHVSFQVGLEF